MSPSGSNPCGPSAHGPQHDPAPPPSGCLVVAIDGTAGAGKSTTAKAVADRLGFRHLDSGAIYRAVALGLLGSGRTMDAIQQVAQEELEALRLRVKWTGRSMEIWTASEPIPDQELRTAVVTAAVSTVSSVPVVREHLLALQRSAAQGPGLVAEGRDMGTVVFPSAQVKVFLVADSRERAHRRLLQDGQKSPTDEEVEAEADRLRRRDAQDSSRRTAPLLAAPDAFRLDTTDLSPEEQVARIVQLARNLPAAPS